MTASFDTADASLQYSLKNNRYEENDCLRSLFCKEKRTELPLCKRRNGCSERSLRFCLRRGRQRRQTRAQTGCLRFGLRRRRQIVRRATEFPRRDMAFPPGKIQNRAGLPDIFTTLRHPGITLRRRTYFNNNRNHRAESWNTSLFNGTLPTVATSVASIVTSFRKDIRNLSKCPFRRPGRS